jgi:hypothetical protein
MWRKTLAPALFAVTLCVPAFADQWNKKTNLTVHEAINVSGTVLPPGEYVMKLANSQSNRHVVQIFNDKENEVKATILAIPNYRLKPTGKTEFVYWEAPAGQPQPLRAWFYPGDNFGQEFVYPKDMAKQIAQTATDPVPTMDSDRSEDFPKAQVRAMDRSGEERDLRSEDYTPTEQAAATAAQTRTPDPAEQQQQQQQTVAQAQPPQTQQARPDPTPAPGTSVADQQPSTRTTTTERTTTDFDELPATASPFAAIGLAGAAATFVGWLMRRKRSRRY